MLILSKQLKRVTWLKTYRKSHIPREIVYNRTFAFCGCPIVVDSCFLVACQYETSPFFSPLMVAREMAQCDQDVFCTSQHSAPVSYFILLTSKDPNAIPCLLKAGFLVFLESNDITLIFR